MSSPDIDVAKQRIISHMNADHQDSVRVRRTREGVSTSILTDRLKLIRYLEHYAKVSRLRSPSAELKDVDLTKMTISAGGRPYNIPFSPPLSSFKEVRERVVQMDQESIKALDRSPVTIKEYLPPKKPVHVITFTTCLLVFLMYSRKENLLPGSGPYETIFKHIPQFAAFSAKLRPLVLYPMLVIHVTETFFMTMKLEKHSVPLLSTVWWSWVLSNFIEGVGAFQRYV